MKYSVVIPTCSNVDDLLPCVESILANSVEKDLELIIINNGSQDHTPKFLEYLDGVFPNLKVINNETNLGFCKATNQGMEVSTGEYIVWLNDDTLVCANWLEKLRLGITSGNFNHDNIGLVGPISNNAAGKQTHKSLQAATPQNIPQVVSDLEAEADRIRKQMDDEHGNNAWRVDFMLTGFLSGFCLMLKRDVYRKIGGIDERFSPGGFCDNDYVRRATEAGFGSVIAPTCFIYHKGSKTLDKLYPEMARGVANWPTYVSKYQSTKDNKLLLLQRIKIDNAKELDLFKDCAAKNLPFIDGVIVLSDRSEHLTYEDVKGAFGDKLVQYIPIKKSAGFSEVRDRTSLLQAGYDSKFDWCIMMDHDECFSEGTERSRIEYLMRPFNPTIFCYEMYFNNFWRSKELARIDGNWGSMFMRRMWKNVFKPKLRPLLSEHDPGLHTGGIPISIPTDCSVPCNLIIDHFGYVDYERTKEKKKFYDKLDTTPDSVKRVLVGDKGYDHLTNESNLKMVSPEPWTLSINTMMKDEEVNVGLMLMQYFSVVDEFVLVDTGSTDRTMEFLDQVGLKYTKMDLDDNFSKIRNKCIELASSKYCMHVDPDERLESGGLCKIVAMLVKNPEVCIWHLQNVQKTGHMVETLQPRIFLKCPELYYSGRVHETLDSALEKIPNIRAEDFSLTSTNTGFLEDDAKIHKKLAFYSSLLEQEIIDNPNNSKSMFELALHHRNYGNVPRAEELLRAAIKINPEYIAAWRELSLIKATEAFNCIKATEGLPATGDMLNSVRDIYQKLQPLAAAHVTVGNPDMV